jgi:hypothetical protein
MSELAVHKLVAAAIVGIAFLAFVALFAWRRLDKTSAAQAICALGGRVVRDWEDWGIDFVSIYLEGMVLSEYEGALVERISDCTDLSIRPC